MYENVFIEIVEQPAEKNARFRYSCEGRSAGSILGVKTSVEKRTYPAIRVLNYTGAAVVLVSCVSKDEPYRPHPHSLVGKDGCCKGVVKKEFTTNEATPTVITFRNIGVQCCRRIDIEKVLSEREELRIDPFKTGFKHKTDKYSDKELNTVRLCFQVLLRPSNNKDNQNVKYEQIKPVVSNPIFDKKFMSDLLIYDISDTMSPTCGGKKMMLFCEKLVKSDIKIRFYKENGNRSVEWEGWGEFKQSNVHRQVAIAFKTPPYISNDIENPVTVFVQLVRPSDGRRSDPIHFQYIPHISNINNAIKNKKRKIEESKEFCEQLRALEEEQRQRAKMKININPMTECRQIPVTDTEPPATSYRSDSNLPSNGQLNNYTAHNNHLQQQQQLQALEDGQRQRSIMTLNINPMPEGRQIPVVNTDPSATSYRSDSNLLSNGQLPNYTVQNHHQQQQQCNYNSQQMSQPNYSAHQSNCNPHHQQQLSNHYLQQPVQSGQILQRADNNHVQPQSSHFSQQPLQSGLLQQQYQQPSTSHFSQQPPLSGRNCTISNNIVQQQSNYFLQQPNQQQNSNFSQQPNLHQQPNSYFHQQNYIPTSSHFQQTYSNSNYGLNLSSNYNPVPYYSNVGQLGNSTAQNVNQFCANDNSTPQNLNQFCANDITMVNHEQNILENNFTAENVENIENLSDSLNSFLL